MPWRIALARSTNSFSMREVVLSVRLRFAATAKPQARGGGPIICGGRGGDEAVSCRCPVAALDSQYVARCAGHEWRSRFERRGPSAGRAGARGDRRLHAPWRAVAGGVRQEQGAWGAGSQLAQLCQLASQARLLHGGDAEDARRVADKLGIPFYALNLQAEFVQIIDYFVDEYTAGRTPNPCVQCNNWIKFGKLFDYADSVGAEFVATGHYARLETLADGSTALLRGVDAAKDQSYVLFGIRSRVVAADDVAGRAASRSRRSAGWRPVWGCALRTRRTARRSVSSRADDTTSSCAAVATTAIPRANWLPRTARSSASTRESRALRSASGKGLGVALGERKFVVRIEPESRRVVVGDRDELDRRELTARGCNWLRFGSDDASAGTTGAMHRFATTRRRSRLR